LCNKVCDNWNALALIHATLLLAARLSCAGHRNCGLFPPSPTPICRGWDPPPQVLLHVVAISPVGQLRSFCNDEPAVKALSPCSSSVEVAPPVEPREGMMRVAAVAVMGVQNVVATVVPVVILAVMLRFSIAAVAVAVAILVGGAVMAVVLLGLVGIMTTAVAFALPVGSKGLLWVATLSLDENVAFAFFHGCMWEGMRNTRCCLLLAPPTAGLR
ncbi:hypothetical protein Vretifemale_11465, partial [Volvox reticuliferus]